MANRASVAASLLLTLVMAYANPIQTENAKPGTTNWQLSNPAVNHEIEGYASLTSVNRGGQIQLFVNTSDAQYKMEFYRMGWYGGTGGRLLLGPISRQGTSQAIPPLDPITGMAECAWVNPYILTVPNTSDPTDWASGIYLVKLTAATTGKQSYIMFVVRDDSRSSDLLFQSSVTTFQAYNPWGGKSLYPSGSVAAAVKVSFNRPYGLGSNPDPATFSGVGAGDFLAIRHSPTDAVQVPPAGFEVNMVRFLEREGYDVTYNTDLDTHTNGKAMFNHKGFLVVGHDEYWTFEMRSHVIAARDGGVNLGFFGSNTAYWQIRFEPSTVAGSPNPDNRTQVCYKDATKDPLGPNNVRTTINFRYLGMPEDAFVGVMYDFFPISTDMVISNASNWIFAGTGLANGSIVKGIIGYEADREFGDQPSNTVVLAHSPWNGSYVDTTWYSASSGANVFAAGTMWWNWALDDYNAPSVRPSVLSPAIQQATRNILNRYASSPFPPPPPPDLALGILPTASTPAGTGGGGTLAAATDGDITALNYAGPVGTGPQWIQVDLGSQLSVSEVKLWHYYTDARRYHGVILQFSNTSDFSSAVTTVFNNDSANAARQGVGTDAEYSESVTGKDIVFPPVTARYVRTWTNGSNVNQFSHFVELEVFGSSGSSNIALNAPVTTSTPLGIGLLSWVDDGDTNTNNYAGLTGTGPQWAVLDLGTQASISEVKLWHYYGDGRRYHGIIVQLSNTADFSSGVTTVFNNDSANAARQGVGTDTEYAESAAGKDIIFPPVSGRYLRTWVNGSNVNSFNHFAEIQVFGSLGTPPPKPNLALGLAATLSSGLGFGQLSWITDGDTNSNNYAGLTGTGPQWASIDLGSQSSISEVKLWHYFADGRKYHGVIMQLSNVPDFSSGVITVFNNDSSNAAGQGVGTDGEYAETSGGKDIVFSPISARYLRTWVDGSNVNPYSHFVEIQVY